VLSPCLTSVLVRVRGSPVAFDSTGSTTRGAPLLAIGSSIAGAFALPVEISSEPECGALGAACAIAACGATAFTARSAASRRPRRSAYCADACGSSGV